MEACIVFQSWCLGGPRIGSDDPFGMKNVSSTSSICWEFWFCGVTRRHCYVYSLRRNKDPDPNLYCLLTVLLWSLCPLNSLINKSLNLLFWNAGNIMESEAHSPKTRNGDMEKLVCPGAPQGPAWSQLEPDVWWQIPKILSPYHPVSWDPYP